MKRNTFLATGVFFASLIAASVTYAYGPGPYGYIQEYTYYSDATYSTAVGHGATGCTGGIIFTSGKVTQHKVIDSTEPCGLW